MGELKLTVEQVKDLMTQMAETDMGQLSLECGDFKLKISSKKAERVIVSDREAAESGRAYEAAPAAAPAEETAPEKGQVVKAPIVGTFYAAPSPEDAPFAAAGTQVKKGDVLFIVESMKLMNEVQSEFDGTVSKVLVKDGEALEYGQPVMVIE